MAHYFVICDRLLYRIAGEQMKRQRIDSCTRLLEMIGIAKKERSRRVYWRMYYRMTRRLNEESSAG